MLDRAIVDELVPAEREKPEHHLSGCGCCQSRRDRLDTEYREFGRLAPTLLAYARLLRASGRLAAAPAIARRARMNRARVALSSAVLAAGAWLAIESGLESSLGHESSRAKEPGRPSETTRSADWQPVGSPSGPRVVVRAKGGPQLGFFVKHAGRVRRGAPGETVYPGDVLRFTYSS